MKGENINKKEILSLINPVVENVANKLKLIIVEINFVKEAGSWHLRIFIYNENRPISHQDCENLTKNLNNYLDELIPVPYYLEVSSPGTERTLKSPREYSIFKGKKAEIKLKQPINDNLKLLQAKILDYTQDHKLKVEISDSCQIICLEENNISRVKLIHEK